MSKLLSLETLRRLASGLLAWWRPPAPVAAAPAPPQPEPAAAAAPADDPPAADPKPRNAPASFRKEVLDQLSDYMFYMRRLKKADHEAYELYRNLGATIVPFDNTPEKINTMIGTTEVEPFFLKALPSFGAFSLLRFNQPLDEDDDSARCRFVYFRRYARGPLEVQPPAPGHAMYIVGFYWDEKDGPKKHFEDGGFMAQVPVSISPKGEVHVLKVKQSRPQTITYRGEFELGGHGHATIQHRVWGVPSAAEFMAEERNEEVNSFVRSMFIMVANMWIGLNYTTMIRIQASRGNQSALLCVDDKMFPDFFRDRGFVASAGSRRAPIFHFVRPHLRTLPNGTVKGVKGHFSGLRRFQWNGYTVALSVPGRDYVDPATAGLSAHDEQAHLRKFGDLKGMRLEEEAASFIAGHIDKQIPVKGRMSA